MNSQVEQLTKELHETFSRNQFEKTLELVSDDVTVNLYALGMTFKKKNGFMDFMQGFKSAFPDITIQDTNIISSGNRVAVEFTANGTHTGTLQTSGGPILPTGKPVTLNVAEFLTWESGKLKTLNNYQDAGSMMKQIGAI